MVWITKLGCRCTNQLSNIYIFRQWKLINISQEIIILFLKRVKTINDGICFAPKTSNSNQILLILHFLDYKTSYFFFTSIKAYLPIIKICMGNVIIYTVYTLYTEKNEPNYNSNLITTT